MKVCLLGRFRVVVDGADCQTPHSSARVIVLLALEGPSSRSCLAGTLWPNTAETQALANLRTALWRLRRSGLNPVEEEVSVLSLPGAVRVDYRTDRDADALMSDLLPHWSEPWLTLHQARWRQVRLHALDQICIDHLAARDWHAARAIAEMVVRQHPSRETAVRHLIAACVGQGDTTSARQAIENFHDALARLPSVAQSRGFDALARDHALAARTMVSPTAT